MWIGEGWNGVGKNGKQGLVRSDVVCNGLDRIAVGRLGVGKKREARWGGVRIGVVWSDLVR